MLLAFLSGACEGDEIPAGNPTPRPSEAPGSPTAGPDATTNPAPSDGSGGGGGGGEGEVARVPGKRGSVTSSGRVPRFVAIRSAAVEGAGTDILFHLALKGRVPPRLPGGARMRVDFTLIAGEGTRYAVTADGAERGWGASVSSTKGTPARPSEVGLVIDGSRMSMTVPRAALGGAVTFDWLVNAAWTHRSAYAFAVLPKRGYASFP